MVGVTAYLLSVPDPAIKWYSPEPTAKTARPSFIPANLTPEASDAGTPLSVTADREEAGIWTKALAFAGIVTSA